MNVIGVFRNIFDGFGNLLNFVNTPLGQLNQSLQVLPFANLSIVGCLSIGLGATLLVLLVIHVVRLFVG